MSRGVVLPFCSLRVMLFLPYCLRAILIRLSGLFNTLKYSLASTSRRPWFSSWKFERNTLPPILIDTVHPPEAPTIMWYLVSPRVFSLGFYLQLRECSSIGLLIGPLAREICFDKPRKIWSCMLSLSSISWDRMTARTLDSIFRY